MLIIGRLISNGKISAYKILNTDVSYTSKVIDADKLTKKIRLFGSDNFKFYNGELVENNGQEDKYPVFDIGQNRLIKNSIVIIKKTGDKYEVTDYNGSIRSVTLEQLATCDRSKIANDISFQEIARYTPTDSSVKNQSKPSSDSMVQEKPKNFNDVISQVLSKVLKRNSADILKNSGLEQRKAEADQTFLGEISVKKFNRQSKISSDTEKKIQPTEEENKGVLGTNAEQEIDTNNTTEEPVQTQEYSEGDYKLNIRDVEGNIKEVYGIIPTNYDGVVVIPDGVTHIAKNSFIHVPIHGVKLPETLKYIGEYAFSYTNLSKVVLPKSIETIPHGCFCNSTSLSKINLENINTLGNNCFEYTGLEEVHIKSDLVQVGLNAFYGCKNLKTFTHMNTIRKIRKQAFAECGSLSEFDFDGVTEVEEQAFFDTGLSEVKLGPEVKYIMPGTFVSPTLTKVDIPFGGYKIGNAAFQNTMNNGITYTLSREITNIGVHLFNDIDTVYCYHNSIVEGMAREAKAKIVYIDDDTGAKSKQLMKAKMLSSDVAQLISEYIGMCYNKDDVDYQYNLDEKGLYKVGLTTELLKYLGLESTSVPDDYEEKPKFKVLLDHYRKACKFYPFPLTLKMAHLNDTFSISNDIIYSDGISRIIEFHFEDHKYESLKADLIVAITGDNVRYCCLNNRLTDIYCRTSESKDLKRLLDLLVPGDIIGYECTLNGTKYDGITGKGDTKKDNVILPVNMYQALFRCSITVKLDKNFIAMILPANNKVIHCATIGGSVWSNETEQAYKERKCSILSVQDLDKCTIFEYGVKSPPRNDALFKLIESMNDTQIANRHTEYSHIGKAEISPYISFRNYCILNGITNLNEMDSDAFSILMRLPIIEERTDDWLDNSIGRTIVEHSRSMLELQDGGVVYQYQTMKRVAMRNKLLTGGDRSIYVYEFCDTMNNRIGIYATNMDLEALFKLAISMKDIEKSVKDNKIYRDKSKFDLVPLSDLILIAAAFVTVQDKQAEAKDYRSNIWLTVYKPNGLYYISYISRAGGATSRMAIPLIQVGELNVVTDYIDCATSKASAGFKILDHAGYYAAYLAANPTRKLSDFRDCSEYHKLLAARALAIDSVVNTKNYLSTGIPPVIAHMFGVHTYGDEIYDIPEEDTNIDEINDFEIDLGVDAPVDQDSSEEDIDISDEDTSITIADEDDDIDIVIDDEDDFELSDEEMLELGIEVDEDADPAEEALRIQRLLGGLNS